MSDIDLAGTGDAYPADPAEIGFDPISTVDDALGGTTATDLDTPGVEGQGTFEDSNADGLVDALIVSFGDGSWVGSFDTTGDGEPDVFAISSYGTGEPDVFVREDGEGGYVMSYDGDHDGVMEEEVAYTRDEMAEINPAVLEFLDLSFSGQQVGPVDGVDAGQPTATEPADFFVDDGQLVGDPGGASEHWFEQAANGFCVPASVTQMVAEYTGSDIPDESWFVERANELHLFQVGPDGVPGMGLDGAAALLADAGIDATVAEDLSITDLQVFLDEGRPVMLAVDSGELWYGEEDSLDEAADHAVVLTGIDPVNGVAVLSDPGSPDGNEYTMPLSELEQMWADSNHAAVVCDDPAVSPGDPAASEQDPVAQDPVAQDAVAQDAAIEAAAGSGVPSATDPAPVGGDGSVGQVADTVVMEEIAVEASPLDGTVAWVMSHPSVAVLAVAVPIGMLVQKKAA